MVVFSFKKQNSSTEILLAPLLCCRL